MIWTYLLISLWAAPKATLLNGTAAIVEKRAITVRDAYLYRALSRFRDHETPVVVMEEGEALRRTVQKVVIQEIALREMQTYKFNSAPIKNTEKWLQDEKVRYLASWQAIQKAFDATESELLNRLWDIARVDEFIQKKVDTLTPVVTEAEALKFFNQNADRYKGINFEAAKESIVMQIKKQETQKGLEEWIKGLRDKYSVTNALLPAS